MRVSENRCLGYFLIYGQFQELKFAQQYKTWIKVGAKIWQSLNKRFKSGQTLHTNLPKLINFAKSGHTGACSTHDVREWMFATRRFFASINEGLTNICIISNAQFGKNLTLDLFILLRHYNLHWKNRPRRSQLHNHNKETMLKGNQCDQMFELKAQIFPRVCPKVATVVLPKTDVFQNSPKRY